MWLTNIPLSRWEKKESLYEGFLLLAIMKENFIKILLISLFYLSIVYLSNVIFMNLKEININSNIGNQCNFRICSKFL